jgi:hypothetical protein
MWGTSYTFRASSQEKGQKNVNNSYIRLCQVLINVLINDIPGRSRRADPEKEENIYPKVVKSHYIEW